MGRYVALIHEINMKFGRKKKESYVFVTLTSVFLVLDIVVSYSLLSIY